MKGVAPRVGSADSKLLPRTSPRVFRWFANYGRRYLRRHFHAVRTLSSHGLTSAFPKLPVVVFLNHASWWDPVICVFLADAHFAGRTSFGPIAKAALERYPLLAKLGLFGVEPKDAASFLRTATAVLASPERMLWVTPQGHFADVRARPVEMQRGLAHVASRVAPAVFLPLAVEYTFWEERKPEILLAWGTPIFTANHLDSCGADDWAGALAGTLQDAQDALAAAAQRRQPNEWSTLLRSSSGSSALYDSWRWFRAKISGQKFRREHSGL